MYMFDFKRLLHNNSGRIIISILLGFGLASLFHVACKNQNCVKFVGPEPNKLKKEHYKFDGKCIGFKEKVISCSKNKKTVSFTNAL